MTKKQFKKYKFDANMPFDIKNTVEFINVSSIKNNVLNFAEFIFVERANR